MTLDMDIAAGERAEAARSLIDRAQDGLVDLATVTALDLCSLGGPAPPLFDETPARAWARREGLQRRHDTDRVTRELTPELGLVLAARRRPAFVVIVQAEDHSPRPLRLFALADEAGPVRGFVLEEAGLPRNPERHFAKVRTLGPLGWFYRYVLVSRHMAADTLARWTVSPPLRSGPPASLGWLVSVWYPDRENPAGHHLRIRGDGTNACLDGLAHSAPDQYDVDGLRAVMLDLLTTAQ
jgi:hypothetical protein